MITTITQLATLAACARGRVTGLERKAAHRTWLEFASHDSVVKTLRGRGLVRFVFDRDVWPVKVTAVTTPKGLKLLDDITERIWPEAAAIINN